MIPFFLILVGISFIGVLAAVIKIIQNKQMRKHGGIPRSSIRDQRLKNRRR